MLTTKRKPATVGEILVEEFMQPMKLTQAAPPSSMNGARVSKLCRLPIMTITKPSIATATDTIASLGHLLRAVCMIKAPAIAPAPKHPSNRP